MPNATPRWQGVRFSYGVSATRSWDVLAPNEGAAIREVGIEQGSTHDLDSSLVASSPEAAENGFNLWIVTINWARAGRGGDGQNNPQKPRVSWRRSVSSEPYDRDPDDNPILNSAYDAFDPPPEIEVADRGFVIRRVEPSYNLAKAEEFENTVNDKDFTFLGKYPFKKGQVRCESILPIGEYDFDAPSLEVEYAFWFRRDGWKRRLVDQGRRAFYADGTDTKKAEIYGPDGTQVSSDALLDGGGSPIDTTLRVGKPPHESANAPLPPLGAEVERTEFVTFLIYKKFRETSFGGLEL